MNSQINFKALGEVHGQNMVRKYNNMMDEDLAELGKNLGRKMNIFIEQKTASIKQVAVSEPQETGFGKHMKCSR